MNDTVKIDLSTGKISDFIRFDTGVIAMATGGRNMGRVGVITHRERHDGGFNIVHIKDAIDNSFATRETNVFVIGNEKPWISLPKGKGVKVRHRWSYPMGLTGSMLIVNSCRLQRKEIVVVHLQLQATRLRTTWSGGRSKEQIGTTSLASDLRLQLSNKFKSYPSIAVLLSSITAAISTLTRILQEQYTYKHITGPLNSPTSATTSINVTTKCS